VVKYGARSCWCPDRDGIVGRDPDQDMKLREDDIVILFGTPEAVLLAG
jgi:hypothetical protein